MLKKTMMVFSLMIMSCSICPMDRFKKSDDCAKKSPKSPKTPKQGLGMKSPKRTPAALKNSDGKAPVKSFEELQEEIRRAKSDKK